MWPFRKRKQPVVELMACSWNRDNHTFTVNVPSTPLHISDWANFLRFANGQMWHAMQEYHFDIMKEVQMNAPFEEIKERLQAVKEAEKIIEEAKKACGG
jgi:hypothetical protein